VSSVGCNLADFLQLVICDASMICGLKNEVHFIKVVAQRWNNMYFHAGSNGTGIGLGGFMREEHTRNLHRKQAELV
jgi:hypothetical protein